MNKLLAISIIIVISQLFCLVYGLYQLTLLLTNNIAFSLVMFLISVICEAILGFIFRICLWKRGRGKVK